MAVRFARITLYPDVPDALEALTRSGRRLALITNGNTYPDRVGLGDAFDVVVIAGASMASTA
jgi:putative hydrolase of the HAD superfamily